ncbi:MAG: hypothetical protein J6589_07610 [Snodgrassella sp.]|uniref:hypothetical protein n=1 Tax=Snodgrassella sp. TaxID=2815304 RepID=UPI00258C48E2|nr:hypothetical protein [Snodgrassella sp.]MCO6514317.1 hypothetical protein [Snodgrassella sp.]MCO6520532.1 hypothetical protein [Snodgrassella sp.]
MSFESYSFRVAKCVDDYRRARKAKTEYKNLCLGRAICNFLEQNPDALYYWVRLRDSGRPEVPFDVQVGEKSRECYQICVHYYALLSRKEVIKSLERWLDKHSFSGVKLELIYAPLNDVYDPHTRGTFCIEMDIKAEY